ncbi:protein transport protein Sec31A-like isoform X6 [Portunus trituberculatus]|uniref:protein transport protein Sec31A-like isoform X6 n=1 Tax=Portunus trituberculatus TaxID=210409 RepID=UPI001E1CB59F|nr:protein transport protein Sec31A-like isoform X6 [Portunus trituberculatus]XP_045138815.1 protein transport protein Sec31A-like isoform X6 [Portunus trituberculatus]
MKVKEISQMANIAWSPAGERPSYLACGTTAKQLDASFNTNSSLILYNLNTGQSNLEMKLTASIESPARFHALQWSGLGSETSGLIYAGCENKAIYIYDAAKLLAKATDSLVGTTQGLHTGPVFTISCNYLKANFLACGSSDSEVTVWDVTNLSAPIIPGKKLSLGADVTCVEFNRQVEHIFASTCAGHCVVWDLRKQSSIMTISDTVSRMKTSNVIWNPHVATQLLLSSDNDLTPWAQMWDLRYATSPIKTLEGHQRGVLKTAWCVHDPNLLITTAKDSKIYVWNPNEANRGSEIVGEFPSYNQWGFDLDWCKHDPSLVAVSSVDGCVSVYSLLGGGLPPAQSDKFSQIADSFPGMDIPAVVPQGATPQPIRLKNPPKWFARSAGASFAFGGRLVSWNNQTRSVEIAQVVTEPELVERSSVLEAALSQPQFGPYCQSKAEAATQPSDQMLWQYIAANFAESPRAKIRELLGYSTTQVSSRLCPAAPETEGITAEVLAEKMANLGTANDGSTGSLDPSEQFEMIASGQSFDKTPETETAELEGEGEATSVPVSLEVEVKEGNNQGLITQALLVGDLESAVDLCLKDGMYPHALTLAAHAGPHLFEKTRDSVLKRVDGSLASLVGAVVRGDLTTIATTTKLSNWKEALVAILTYCSNEQFSQLAEALGERLEAKGDSEALLSAMICYVCAGSLEKCVSCWIKTRPSTNKPQDLQDLVEIIMGLQRSLSCAGHSVNLSEGSTVSSLLCQYASLLAAQGVLRTAVSYLNSATHGEMAALRDRLYRALGYPTGSSTATPATSHQTNQRRTSTPHAYGQPQPSQFTPSVQDQQRSVFGAPPPQPPSASMQNPTFYNPMNPSGPVPQQITPMEPQYGAPPSVAVAPPQGPSPAGGLRRGRPGRYVPDSSVTSSVPSGMLNPIQPMPYFSPPPGVTPTSLGTSPSAAPQFFSPMSSPTDSTLYGDPQQQQQHPQAQLPAKTPAALDSSVPRGWNDPPPPSASRKAKQQQQQQQSEAAKPVEPIMCPVPGGMMPEPPQQFMGFQHPQYGAEAIRSPPAGPTAAVGEAAVPASEPPVKGPLPAEHQVIQDVLNEVRNRCLLVVQNQQMKQRLEEIGVKMELLYDRLRMNQLSPASVSGVHRIVSHVQSGDYRGALTVHAETIAKGSFSELSCFMPPLKLLLQYCMQLQVFLQ